LISENGTLEFAKRYWSHDLQVDLSPISLKALTMCRTTLGLCQIAHRYNIQSVNVVQRLGGAGYRVRARLLSTQSRRWSRLRAALGKPYGQTNMPLEFLIGRGNPLNPYLRGKIILYLLREFKPKEIHLFPDSSFIYPPPENVLGSLRCCRSVWIEHILRISNLDP